MGQKSEVGLTRLKLRFEKGCAPSGGIRGESVSLPLPAFRGHVSSMTHGLLPPCSKLAMSGQVLLMLPCLCALSSAVLLHL